MWDNLYVSQTDEEKIYHFHYTKFVRHENVFKHSITASDAEGE